MKKYKLLIPLLPIILGLAFFAYAISSPSSPLFPRGLNNFQDGDIIQSNDWNNIETDLGTHIGNVATGTPQTINWIIRNGSFATTSIKIGTIATTTIAGDNGASTLSTTTVQGYFNTGIITATSSITTNNLTVNGTCTGCTTATINSGTTNRFAYYSGATTLDSANGFQLNAANGSTTIPIINVGTLTATTGTSIIQALTVSNGFTVTAGSVSLPAGSVANAALANSTISGVALGGTLANLTALNGTLTFSATYTGASAVTIGLNLNQQNTWTASSTHPVLNTGTLTATSSTVLNTLQTFGSSTLAGFYNTGNATTSGSFEINSGQLVMRYASTTGATIQTINWDNGNTQRVIPQAATDIVINATSSNPRDGGKYVLKICQGGTGYATQISTSASVLRYQGGNNATTVITSTAFQGTMMGMIYDARSTRYDVVASSTMLLCNN